MDTLPLSDSLSLCLCSRCPRCLSVSLIDSSLYGSQVRDARSATFSADVYSLGATWYAALTARLPFDGTSPAAVMAQVLHGKIVPPSVHVADVPAGVEAMILWLLQTEPSKRPRSGPMLIAELESTLAHPHDAKRVQKAKEAMARSDVAEARLRLCGRCVAGVIAAFVFAWLVWECMQLQPEAGANDGQDAAGDRGDRGEL